MGGKGGLSKVFAEFAESPDFLVAGHAREPDTHIHG
jgi:hypothetical protein